MGGFLVVSLLNALLGQHLCPSDLVHLAAVKQGSSRVLLLQVRLLGNLSFQVLLL